MTIFYRKRVGNKASKVNKADLHQAEVMIHPVVPLTIHLKTQVVKVKDRKKEEERNQEISIKIKSIKFLLLLNFHDLSLQKFI